MKRPCIIFYRFNIFKNEKWEELEKANSLDEARELVEKHKNQSGREHWDFKIVLDDHNYAT